jgi:hypothetical protein
MDLDPAVGRWGRRHRHLTADMLELAALFPREHFDVVLCTVYSGLG